jgi:hypothetical protein
LQLLWPSIPLAPSQTPGASLLLLCPRKTSCAQPPPLLRCSTRPAPRTLTEAHTSRRRQPSEAHLRMSGGKAYGKQAARYTGKQPEGGSVTSRDTEAAENEVHSSGHTHRKSRRLKEMSAAKQAGGKGEAEEGKQPAAQKKMTCTSRQATQTQPVLLAELQALYHAHREATRLFFDGGKSGSHRRADSGCFAARAPSSH